MDIQAIIASGVLEAYVLGHANEQEARAVECLSRIYPEIRQALDELESDLGAYARAHEAELPEGLRERILAEVRKTPQEEVVVRTLAPEVPAEPRGRGGRTLGWAAALAATVVLGTSLYYQSRSVADLEEENSRFQQEVVGLQQILLQSREELVEQEQLLAAVADPRNTLVELKGMNSLDGAWARVYWNRENHRVILAPGTMPPAPEGRQYQLWALVNGTPVDMGVMPLDPSARAALMKEASAADAFAITLEPEGGQPTPSLDQLVCMGQVPT